MPRYEILTTADDQRWLERIAPITARSLVHHPQYTRVYERYGDGVGECFVYQDGGCVVLYPYLRRTIPESDGLSDITTPYGYGGWVWSSSDPEGERAFLEEFRDTFASYARSTGIVSEFLRFHPFLQNQKGFEGLLNDVTLHCTNALMDLAVGEEGLTSIYRSSYRQCIRKAAASGLVVEQAGDDRFIDEFFQLYSASMARKRQEGYLRFRREFLEILRAQLGGNLLCFRVRDGSSVASAALFLRYGEYLDYFLAASDPEYLPSHPNHLLLHSVATFGIRTGARWLHLGGGHPSLQFFKHGFANASCAYYVGRHVHDRYAYDRLTAERWHDLDQAPAQSSKHFPAYRAEASPRT